MYTDTDWQSPSPYPFGHAAHPRYPPPIRRSRTGRFSELLHNATMEATSDSESVFESEDEDTELTGMEIRNAQAETRRRRWLRRAIWVGNEKPTETLEAQTRE